MYKYNKKAVFLTFRCINIVGGRPWIACGIGSFCNGKQRYKLSKIDYLFS